jgi:hypothetical protein
MKRKGIPISLALVAACGGALYLYSLSNSLDHGYIELDAGDAAAELKLRSGLFGRVNVVSGVEPVEVNMRILRPLSLTISNNNNNKRLMSYGPWGDLSKIKVADDLKTVVELGPPFIIRPNVRKSADRVLIDFSIFGKAGEKYVIPRISPAPKVIIMDENDKILASGSFSYG